MQATLLDEEGSITDALERVLGHIFAKYCTPSPDKTDGLLQPPPGAVMKPIAFDQWAKDTNGVPLGEDQKEEIREFMDVDDDGNLTYKGFIQIYQLQTASDEDETWRDLARHGFDKSLTLNTIS